MNASRLNAFPAACLLAWALVFQPGLQAQTRWKLDADGAGIAWAVEPGKAHQDHIEMSGRRDREGA